MFKVGDKCDLKERQGDFDTGIIYDVVDVGNNLIMIKNPNNNQRKLVEIDKLDYNDNYVLQIIWSFW